jgi:carboxyl-terminal processing protease
MKNLALLFALIFIRSFVVEAQEKNLTEQEKLFGLSYLWSEARYNFVYIDNIGPAWDSIYTRFIPRVQKTKSVKEYYDVLKSFYSFLNDSHSVVYYPDSIQNQIGSPPVRTKYLEGKVIVKSVLNDSLKQSGFVPGLEVMKVNDVDAVEYGKKYVEPYVCSATLQDRIKRIYDYQFLRGEKNTSVRLTLKNESGVVFTVNLSRNLPATSPVKPQLRYEMLNDSIGLLTISSFMVTNFQGIFDSIYPMVLKSRALIIDIRKNGGGDGSKANYVLRHIIGKPYKTAEFSTWINNPIEKTMTGSTPAWLLSKPDIYHPFEDVEQYKNPIIVMISEETHSAAEDFCLAFDYSQRGKLIGTATAGSTGRPYNFDLPGGGMASVCTKKDTYPDGKIFVGIGIQPGIEVKESISSIRSGKDVVLERAVAEMKFLINK